jgi:uncharacterized protein YecT (DUF1311 family)
MKKIFILTATTLLIFTSNLAFSEKECGYTQQELNECVENGKNIADAELNRLYKVQMSYLKTPEKKEQLKKAQLAWIKYRDAVCEYEVTSQGGSMYPMAVNGCIQRQTMLRNVELNNYIQCRENGCPD